MKSTKKEINQIIADIIVVAWSSDKTFGNADHPKRQEFVTKISKLIEGERQKDNE